ncbi:CAP domain-containing protein [Microbacteriaceae bacterium 4G12]
MKKNRLLATAATLALSLSVISGCATQPKNTAQEQKKVNDPATKKVVNTGKGYITKRPISATPDDTLKQVRYNDGRDGRYSKYYSYQYAVPYGQGRYYTGQPGQPSPGAGTTTPVPPTGQTTPPTTQTPAPTPAPKPSTPSTNAPANSIVAQVIQLTNQERRKNGLSDLQMSSPLEDVAQKKAVDMDSKGYFSHTSPTYGSPFDMMKTFGISYSYAGENIAKGQTTAQQVVTDWMNSPGHRANILNQNYTHIGVGHTGSQNCWVQMFIKK